MAALWERDVQSRGPLPFLHVAPAAAAGALAHHVHGAVADVVVAVADEVLGRELPVAGDDPFFYSAEDFHLSASPVPGIQKEIEIG